MILILTNADDGHADYVSARRCERGAAFVRFNPANFPTRASLSLRYAAWGETCYTLHTEDGPMELDDLTSVWLRRPDRPVAHDVITDGTRN